MHNSKTRGANSNPKNRFHEFDLEPVLDPAVPVLRTEIQSTRPRTIISFNQSPDVPFEASINPYHGCEHGCTYCFARPSHEYLDLSAGLDFETKLFYKPGAAELLRKELSKKNHRCTPINLGVNTDCYQPLEKSMKITRSLLKVFDEFNHPCALITKSTLVLRDCDVLQSLAKKNLVQVMVSVTTLDSELKRSMEPRAAAPLARLKVIECLSNSGIPTGMLMAPVIPGINDQEIESIIKRSADAGASNAGYVLIRLPYQVKKIFSDWLESYAPLKAAHVLKLIESCRGGKLYDSSYGQRMTGQGEIASLIKHRFHLACKKQGISLERRSNRLRTDLFRVPGATTQMSLL